MPELIKEFDFQANLAIDMVGTGPFGQRIIANVTNGQITGDRINGTIVGAGADWLLASQDGFGRLDVRLTFRPPTGR
jgi:hypothetical protein